MDIIFMGTPDFAVPVLEALTASEKHTVKAVVTQPDKARGRSGKLIFTPVKEVAVKHGIPVYTPQKVKDPEFVEKTDFLRHYRSRCFWTDFVKRNPGFPKIWMRQCACFPFAEMARGSADSMVDSGRR